MTTSSIRTMRCDTHPCATSLTVPTSFYSPKRVQEGSQNSAMFLMIPRHHMPTFVSVTPMIRSLRARSSYSWYGISALFPLDVIPDQVLGRPPSGVDWSAVQSNEESQGESLNAISGCSKSDPPLNSISLFLRLELRYPCMLQM